MASTYSQYKIELVGTGEQAGTWGTTTNNNFGSATPGTYQGFEQAIGGRADVTMSGTTTLSLTNSNAAQDARALYLNLSGTLSGAADLVVPALQKSYLVKNGTTGGFAVTIKVIGQTGVSIPNGKTVWVYNNGTDIVTAVDFIPEIATTTVDATNIEVTNIKAKDGTSAGTNSIADSTGVINLCTHLRMAITLLLVLKQVLVKQQEIAIHILEDMLLAQRLLQQAVITQRWEIGRFRQ
jgi:hypothetical protein